MKRKIGWYRRLSQILRLPLAGPIFSFYAPRRQWSGNTRSATPPKILIVNLMLSLGDTICYMALAEAIRNAIPEAEITWLADEGVANLVAAHPDVDHVLTIRRTGSRLEKIPTVGSYYRVFQIVKQILALPLQEPFDVALMPRGGIDPSFSAHAAWVLNLPVAAGYSHLVEPTDTEHAYPDCLFTHLERTIVTLHESARSIHLLSLTGLVPNALEQFDRQQPLRGLLSIAHSIDVTPLLEKAEVPPGVPFIVLSPFAGVPRREWPPEKFRELVRIILEKTDLDVVIIGTENNRTVSKAICKDFGERVHDTSGKFNLKDLIAVISASKAFVGNDSGAGHIAGALGIPVISLHVHAKNADSYHKSSPEQCMPLGPSVTVLRPERFLPGCVVRCESETVHCLAQITVEEVWEALQRFIT